MYHDYPFDHWVIDDFLDIDLANTLSNDFIEYNDRNWFCYDNPLEHKKTLNNWYCFPPTTYQFFTILNSPDFIDYITEITNIKHLYPDIGLHGAGWHIHEKGGKLNIHLDYNIHPKLELQRKLNIIIYLTENWDISWGGNLEFWSHDKKNNKPKEKIKTIDNIFNRAVIFDTTQNSWHGFPQPLTCPKNVYRKSIAMYYLCEPKKNSEQRKRALYAPSEQQINDPDILKFIKQRSQ